MSALDDLITRIVKFNGRPTKDEASELMAAFETLREQMTEIEDEISEYESAVEIWTADAGQYDRDERADARETIDSATWAIQEKLLDLGAS